MTLISNFFHHTTCESTRDTLPSSAANQSNNRVSVAQGGSACISFMLIFNSNRFLMLRNHMGIVVPRAFHSCWNPFYIRRLFGSFFFSFILFMHYRTKALQTNIIYNSAERCYLLINGALKMDGEQKESSWSKFVQVAVWLPLGH